MSGTYDRRRRRRMILVLFAAAALALDAADPANIESVAFTLDATAGTVKAKLVAASVTYTDCTNTGGNDWSCNVEPNPTVLSADELRVIATQ